MFPIGTESTYLRGLHNYEKRPSHAQRCTAIGNLDNSLNQDCATITIYLKGVSDGSTDDFVEKTPISKEMTDKVVRYHQEQDEIKRQKEKADER